MRHRAQPRRRPPRAPIAARRGGVGADRRALRARRARAVAGAAARPARGRRPLLPRRPLARPDRGAPRDLRGRRQDPPAQARAALQTRLADLRREPQPCPPPSPCASPTSATPATSLVLLEERDGARRLPIWIGAPEAYPLAARLHDVDAPRPGTYRFAADLLAAAGSALKRSRIVRLADRSSTPRRRWRAATASTRGRAIEHSTAGAPDTESTTPPRAPARRKYVSRVRVWSRRWRRPAAARRRPAAADQRALRSERRGPRHAGEERERDEKRERQRPEQAEQRDRSRRDDPHGVAGDQRAPRPMTRHEARARDPEQQQRRRLGRQHHAHRVAEPVVDTTTAARRRSSASRARTPPGRRPVPGPPASPARADARSVRRTTCTATRSMLGIRVKASRRRVEPAYRRRSTYPTRAPPDPSQSARTPRAADRRPTTSSTSMIRPSSLTRSNAPEQRTRPTARRHRPEG